MTETWLDACSGVGVDDGSEQSEKLRHVEFAAAGGEFGEASGAERRGEMGGGRVKLHLRGGYEAPAEAFPAPQIVAVVSHCERV